MAEQPELPKLESLPAQPEPLQVSQGARIGRALAVFLAGVNNRPDLAAALAQQFQQQDEAARAEAENRFRNDMFLAQAINAQRVQEFGLQQEAAEAPGKAKLQDIAIRKGEQEISAGETEAQQKAALEKGYPSEKRGQIAMATDIAQLENLRMELLLHKMTLASTEESLKNAQSEDQAQELARVRDHLKFLIDQKQAAFDVAAKASQNPLEALAAPGGGPNVAELYKSALTVEPNEQAQILGQMKLIAPHIPEENLKGLISQAFNVPQPWNRATVFGWTTAINELNNAVGPSAIPLAASLIAKGFVAGGMTADEADAAAADVLTNEDSPESLMQRGARAIGEVPAEAGKFIGRKILRIQPHGK